MKKKLCKYLCIVGIVSAFFVIFTISASAITVNGGDIPTYNFTLPNSDSSNPNHYDTFNNDEDSSTSYFTSFFGTVDNGQCYYYELVATASEEKFNIDHFLNFEVIREVNGTRPMPGLIGYHTRGSSDNTSSRFSCFLYCYDTNGSLVYTLSGASSSFVKGYDNYWYKPLPSITNSDYLKFTCIWPLGNLNMCPQYNTDTIFYAGNGLKNNYSPYVYDMANYLDDEVFCNISINGLNYISPSHCYVNINGDTNKKVRITGRDENDNPIYDITYNENYAPDSVPSSVDVPLENVDDLLANSNFVSAFDFVTDKFERIIALPYLYSLVLFSLTMGVIIFFIGRRS